MARVQPPVTSALEAVAGCGAVSVHKRACGAACQEARWQGTQGNEGMRCRGCCGCKEHLLVLGCLGCNRGCRRGG